MSIPRVANALGYIDDDLISGAITYTKKKKKHNWLKWSIMAACLCFALTAAIVHMLSPLKTNVVETDRLRLATSVDSLKAVSDIIVVAHVEHVGENTLIRTETGDIISGYTNTTITVDAIFKGNIQIDNSLVVTEECYTTALGTIFWTQHGYMPMRSGSKYILFLKAYPDDSDFAGKYFPIDLEYGKYVIPLEFSGNVIEALSNNRHKLEIGEATDLKVYLEWYYSIMSEYFSTGGISLFR